VTKVADDLNQSINTLKYFDHWWRPQPRSQLNQLLDF